MLITRRVINMERRQGPGVVSTSTPQGRPHPCGVGGCVNPHTTTAQRRLNRAGRPRRVVTPHVSKTSPVGALQEPRAALWLR